jgi:hypothetical protein
MRIRDAITKPVFLITAGALALTAITTVAIVGTSSPPRDSYTHRCEPVPPPAPPISDDRPMAPVSL